MKRLATVLISCLSILGSACDEPTSDGSGAPAAAGEGGKADDNSDPGEGENELTYCASIELDYLACKDESASGTACEAMIGQDYVGADLCCTAGDEFAYCDLSEWQWCDELGALVDECDQTASAEACDDYQGSKLFSLCTTQYTDRECYAISTDFEACEREAPADVSCGEYLHEAHPWAGNCCGVDGYDDVCSAYEESFTQQSCQRIADAYDDCQSTATEGTSCEGYLQNIYPLGGSCCGVDGFDAACQAY